MTTQFAQEMEKLYKEDFILWIDQTVKLLKQRNLESLDWEHLIEEIEGLGSEQRHKVDSYLLQLLVHLLLYRYWENEKEQCARGWRNEITNFRIQLEILFDSKTLQNYFLERINYIYPKARRQAIRKTEIPPTIFPEQCLFTPEQMMDSEFFPE